MLPRLSRTTTLLPLACLLLLPGCVGEAQDAGPKPGDAECRRATSRVKIDGVLDEVAWQKAQEIDFTVFWEKRKPRTAAKARLLWDDQYLYFAGEMEDHDLYADVRERQGMCWYNDVFELFFKPAEDKRAYYELQVNALNTKLELALPSRGAGGFQRFAPVTDMGMETAVRLRGTLNDHRDRDQGWTVEGRIPWKGFEPTGGRPKAGAKWRFALCRYDYSADFEREDLSSTAPLTAANFHQYEDYGILTFVGGE